VRKRYWITLENREKMKNKHCIYLIGFMASGKSTVGKLLSTALGFLFIDIDSVIEQKEGMKISEIFHLKGEGYFREVETSQLERLTTQYSGQGVVLATGGGLPCNTKNLQFMQKHGILVYLKTSVDDIMRRIGEGSTRPVFKQLGKSKEEVETLLKERETYYNQADLIEINTNNTTPEEVAEKIKKNLETLP
jgi:shikimate kinase